jgi:hypothetical protein
MSPPETLGIKLACLALRLSVLGGSMLEEWTQSLNVKEFGRLISSPKPSLSTALELYFLDV